MRWLFFSFFALSLASLVFSQEFSETNTVTTEVSSQMVFKVGGREQRVRFFLSNTTNITNLIAPSEQSNKLSSDLVKPIDTKSSFFAFISYTPTEIGLSDFAEGSNRYGLIVNFPLISCAVKLVDMVKILGDTKKDEFELYRIDEINIFLKPVSNVSAGDYKINISPVAQNKKDPALNVQIPIVMPDSLCKLPTKEALDKAFQDTVCMGNAKMSYCTQSK